MARSGVKLPRYDNGSFSASSQVQIPILFSDTQYNVVEIRVRFFGSAGDTINLGAKNAAGTGLNLYEFQSTTKRFNTSDSVYAASNAGAMPLAPNNGGLSVDGVSTITMCKATGNSRNHFFFDTAYLWGGIGAARSSGQGFFDTSATVGNLYIFPGSGTVTGTYSTIHYY